MKHSSQKHTERDENVQAGHTQTADKSSKFSNFLFFPPNSKQLPTRFLVNDQRDAQFFSMYKVVQI